MNNQIFTSQLFYIVDYLLLAILSYKFSYLIMITIVKTINNFDKTLDQFVKVVIIKTLN